MRVALCETSLVDGPRKSILCVECVAERDEGTFESLSRDSTPIDRSGPSGSIQVRKGPLRRRRRPGLSTVRLRDQTPVAAVQISRTVGTLTKNFDFLFSFEHVNTVATVTVVGFFFFFFSNFSRALLSTTGSRVRTVGSSPGEYNQSPATRIAFREALPGTDEHDQSPTTRIASPGGSAVCGRSVRALGD